MTTAPKSVDENNAFPLMGFSGSEQWTGTQSSLAWVQVPSAYTGFHTTDIWKYFRFYGKCLLNSEKVVKYLLMNFLANFGGRRPLSDPVSWLTRDGGLAPIVGALCHHLGVGRGDGGPAGQGGAGQVWSVPGVGLILFQCDKG